MADIQYDSKTGERLPENWRTPKFDVPDMTGLNRNALAQIFRDNKTEEALKYVEAAIQMQGQRGYQNALKSGEAAEKAIAKYGPMMFYRSPNAFAPSVKALTPPPVIPNAAWNSANTNTGAPGYFQLGKGGVNVPRPADTLAREKFEWLKTRPPKPGPADYTTFSKKLEEDQPATPAITGSPAEKRFGWFGIDRLAEDKPAVEAQPARPFREAGTYTSRIAPPASLTAQAAQTAPPARVTKAGTVTTREQFDALPSGTVYTGKDGKQYRKP